MKTRANIAGHPIHPMLVVFPIGLWVFSFICDLIYLAGATELWRNMAFYSMAGGVIGALAAAIPGAIDLFTMEDRDTKRIGLIHMTLNLTLVALFLINLVWRFQTGPLSIGPVWLSAISIVLLGVSGWLGGEMVYVHGAAVSPEALRAPEVLRAETAMPTRPGGRIERRHATTIPYVGPERRRA